MCATLPSLTNGFGQSGQMPFCIVISRAVRLQAGNLAVATYSDANSEADERSCSYRNQSSLNTPKQHDTLWEETTLCPHHQMRRPFRNHRRPDTGSSCYKFGMPKSVVQWLLFKYIDGEVAFLSKPFKTKQLAEKARSKYPERERKKIGVGVIRDLTLNHKKEGGKPGQLASLYSD